MRSFHILTGGLLVAGSLVLAGCGSGNGKGGGDTGDTGDVGDDDAGEGDVYRFANGCFALRSGDLWLERAGENFSFSGGAAADAAAFLMRPADLGTYLLFDEEEGYLYTEAGPLERVTSLESDTTRIEDGYISGAEWELEDIGGGQHRMVHRQSGRPLGTGGLADDEAGAAELVLEPAEGCATFPELSLDAQGEVDRTTFDDGDLYGIVDTHSHIMSNWGFGGGGIFHGAPFHRLGVEHALPDCELYHGPMGRKDFFGYAFDQAGADNADLTSLIPALLAGELDEDNHITDGYPQFTEWPNAPSRSTHQTQYYRWLERAHLAGLRLVVQHATTNSVICHMTAGSDVQQVRYSCDDMVAVDRIIEETRAMERYVDAQEGGPGEGWFRVVETPAEAREVITEGKMAVVLGIETSDLFDCTSVPRAGGPTCDADYVRATLDDYYARGVRVMFPVHKYDNAFSAGDGDRAFIELGNFFNSGHWGNFVEDCPEGVPTVFDRGDVTFGGLNMPRDEYISAPPNDMSQFPNSPIGVAFNFLSQIEEPPLVGDYCQKTGLTPLGETLLLEMMARGMIIEVDHLPRRAYARAFELLEQNDYPAAGTHGTNFDGRIYALGGVSKTGLGRCRDANQPGSTLDGLANRIALIEQSGGYPAEGFGFDLNGFAGARGPRLAEGACPTPQSDPVTYPFESYAGDVTFTAPRVGERDLDFNTEGLVHIGMLPELLEDARGDAQSDADLEPLFRSAEGYIRMWEKAETRAAALSGGG